MEVRLAMRKSCALMVLAAVLIDAASMEEMSRTTITATCSGRHEHRPARRRAIGNIHEHGRGKRAERKGEWDPSTYG